MLFGFATGDATQWGDFTLPRILEGLRPLKLPDFIFGQGPKRVSLKK